MFDSTVLSINWIIYSIFWLIIFSAEVFILRKSIYVWFDPLLLYIFTNSFGIAFVFYLFFIEKDINYFYFITFLVNTISFNIGLFLGNRRLDIRKSTSSIEEKKLQIYSKYSKWLNSFLIISLVILILSNIALVLKFGKPALLTDNPSISKVEYRSDGFGLVYKIGDALYPLCLSIIALKLFHPCIAQPKNKSLILGIYAFTCLILIALGGSKGDIFISVNILFSVYMINFCLDKKVVIKKIKLGILLTLTICISVFFTTLLISNKDSYSLFQGLAIRFIGSYDGLFYFSHFDLMSDFNYSPLDFLWRAINPFLAMLRMADYETSLGELIFNKATGFPISGFGPNSTYNIESLLFFGSYFAWFYSFLVGYLISFIRTSFLLKVISNPTQLNFIYYIMLSVFILRLPVESSSFFVAITSLFVFGIPLFLISGILLGLFVKHIKSPVPQARNLE